VITHLIISNDKTRAQCRWQCPAKRRVSEQVHAGQSRAAPALSPLRDRHALHLNMTSISTSCRSKPAPLSFGAWRASSSLSSFVMKQCNATTPYFLECEREHSLAQHSSAHAHAAGGSQSHQPSQQLTLADRVHHCQTSLQDCARRCSSASLLESELVREEVQQVASQHSSSPCPAGGTALATVRCFASMESMTATSIVTPSTSTRARWNKTSGECACKHTQVDPPRTVAPARVRSSCKAPLAL